jgi:hypothetical protein
MEDTMFNLIIILILIPGTFLPLALSTLFSSAELREMGVCLEDAEELSSDPAFLQPQPIVTKMFVAC